VEDLFILIYFCNYDCITKAYNEKGVLLHVPPYLFFTKTSGKSAMKVWLYIASKFSQNCGKLFEVQSPIYRGKLTC
jgi:hypothetical protein